jgi:hypothetical protein
MPARGFFDRFTSAVFVDEVVNEFFSVAVLQLFLGDARFLEETLQLVILAVDVEARIGVPTHVGYVFEVQGDADVGLGDVSFALC